MAGRPTKMTAKTLGKLKEAFLLGCTDIEACFYADIHPDTLYAYQKRNPKYSEQKECFKSNPILLARKTVVNALKNDPRLAMRFLEKRKSDEFAGKLSSEATDEASETYISGFTYVVSDGSKIPEQLYNKRGKEITIITKSQYENQKSQ